MNIDGLLQIEENSGVCKTLTRSPVNGIITIQSHKEFIGELLIHKVSA